jgi:hypothetical protein
MKVYDGDEESIEEPSLGLSESGVLAIVDRAADGLPDGAHELAYRKSDGISVRLSWNPRADEVFVHVRNERDNEEFVLNPPKSDALFAFYHPYAATGRSAEPWKLAA